MKIYLTRLLAPLLALIMVFTAFPVYAFADQPAEEPAVAAEVIAAEEVAEEADEEVPAQDELEPLSAGNQFWVDGVAYDASKEHTASTWDYQVRDGSSILAFTDAKLDSIKIDSLHIVIYFGGTNSIGSIELAENMDSNIYVSEGSTVISNGIYGKGGRLSLTLFGNLTVNGGFGSNAAPAIFIDDSEEQSGSLKIGQYEYSSLILTGGTYSDGSQAEALSASDISAAIDSNYIFSAKGGNAIVADYCRFFGSGGYNGKILLQGGKSPEGTGYCFKKKHNSGTGFYGDLVFEGNYDITLISGNENEPTLHPDVIQYVGESCILVDSQMGENGTYKEVYEPKKYSVKVYNPITDSEETISDCEGTTILGWGYFSADGYIQIAWSDGSNTVEWINIEKDDSTVYTAVFITEEEFALRELVWNWDSLQSDVLRFLGSVVVADSGSGISPDQQWCTAEQKAALEQAYSEAESALNSDAEVSVKSAAVQKLTELYDLLSDQWGGSVPEGLGYIEVEYPSYLLVKKSAPAHAYEYDEFDEETGSKLTWSSLDPSIAKVDAKGKLTGVSAGTAIIMVTGSLSSVCFEVEVIQPISGLKLGKTKETLVVGGSMVEIPIIVTDKTGKAEPEFLFDFDEDFVNVGMAGDNVLAIMPKDMPTNKTVVTVKDYYSGKSAKITLKIGAPANCVTTSMKSTDLEVFAGKTLSLKAAGAVQGTAVKPINTSVEWMSSDESIAIVDAKGKVKALSCGHCTITASVPEAYGTGSLSFDVTVLPVLKSVMFQDKSGKKLTKTTAVAGQQLDLAEIADPVIEWIGGEPDASMYEVSFVTTAKPAVAELNGMVLDCNGKGSAAIKMVVVCGKKKKQASLTVKIDAPK